MRPARTGFFGDVNTTYLGLCGSNSLKGIIATVYSEYPIHPRGQHVTIWEGTLLKHDRSLILNEIYFLTWSSSANLPIFEYAATPKALLLSSLWYVPRLHSHNLIHQVKQGSIASSVLMVKTLLDGLSNDTESDCIKGALYTLRLGDLPGVAVSRFPERFFVTLLWGQKYEKVSTRVCDKLRI